jgi:hypothetical protein
MNVSFVREGRRHLAHLHRLLAQSGINLETMHEHDDKNELLLKTSSLISDHPLLLEYNLLVLFLNQHETGFLFENKEETILPLFSRVIAEAIVANGGQLGLPRLIAHMHDLPEKQITPKRNHQNRFNPLKGKEKVLKSAVVLSSARDEVNSPRDPIGFLIPDFVFPTEMSLFPPSSPLPDFL